MTVPVVLSGQGPYRFLVDTGADRTALSREVADRLKLVRGQTARLHSVAGMQEVATADVPSPAADVQGDPGHQRAPAQCISHGRGRHSRR